MLEYSIVLYYNDQWWNGLRPLIKTLQEQGKIEYSAHQYTKDKVLIICKSDKKTSSLNNVYIDKELYLNNQIFSQLICQNITSADIIENFTSCFSLFKDSLLLTCLILFKANFLNLIIRHNLTNEQFTVDMLASEMAVSRSNLRRKILGVTGLAPNDYIRLVRLKVAAELLDEGKYRVNEVCYLIGFSNHSYFARCFQKQFGVLPKDYKKG